MRSICRSIRLRLLSIPPGETDFATRGFRGGSGGMRQRIESIGQVFIQGYQAALESDSMAELAHRLGQIDRELQGFAYEGAAMSIALLGRLLPWRRRRLGEFLSGAGGPHTYMVHVAAGWAAARLPGPFEWALKPLDPLLRWLAADGFGFHEGFFKWPQYIEGQPCPGRLQGYARRAFDQGLGRSLWFIEGGEPERIGRTAAKFAFSRQPDLWSGIGLAATYAGQVGEDALIFLQELAAPFLPHLAQGSAFAAKARIRAGNASQYTDLACHRLCGLPAAEAALVTDAALENLPASQAEPAYEIWRSRIQNRFAQLQESNR